ncbi:MAG: carboxypeptidase regulatory-like domain-containing protein, partial [candidate division Zixibacteria bacterium]|nr:carboxypeptidase regulatory-like domain-containing protein [candidate division Zixibacteria bacterium]
MKSLLRGLPLWPILITILAILPNHAQGIPCLTGIVRDASGVPVVGGDLDFDNALTGQRLVTLGDNTGAGGFYSVCVLPGLYHVSFEPPLLSRLVGKR